jgi:iron(III) transport system permease protein
VLRGGRHATVSGKGHRETRIELGAWRGPARGLMLVYLLVATVLPMLALAFVALNGFWTADVEWSRLSLDALRESLLEDRVTQRALRNSLTLGAVGATVGMAAAAVIALFVLRVHERIGRFVDAAIKMPSVLSNIVVAVGVVLAFAGPPFWLAGTTLILLVAYVVLYMPQGSVAADAAASQVGRELPEASHVSGAGGARTFRSVQLPIMLPGLVAGWALLFVRMVGDLTASAMLAGTRNPVVGFRILEVYQNGSYALLACLATALTVVTSMVLAGVLWFSRRAARRGLGSGGLRV